MKTLERPEGPSLGAVVVTEDDLGDLRRIQMALHGFLTALSAGSATEIDPLELAMLIEPHVHKMKKIMERIDPASE
jgi:hypothetical protein